MALIVSNTATIQSSTSLAAAGTQSSSATDVSGSIGGEVTAKITNGATGPTVPCTVFLENSIDAGSTYQVINAGTAPTANSAVQTFAFPFGAGLKSIRARFTGNTVQAVTVEAQITYATLAV